MIDPATDISEFTIARLSRTMSELEHKLRELGPCLKRVRMAQRYQAELGSTPTFRGVPVVFDLPDSHPIGFVFCYEA